MVLYGDKAIVLAPTAGPTTGAYTFSFSLFEVDLTKNSSRVLKEMGDIALPPELAAGYPAAHLPGDNKMYVILGNKDVTVSGHSLYVIDMDNGNVTFTCDAKDVMALSVCPFSGKQPPGFICGVGTGSPRGGALTVYELSPGGFQDLSQGSLDFLGPFALQPPALAAGATSCPSVPCDTHSVHVLGIDVSDPSNQTALNSPYLLSLNFGQMDPARSTKVPFCTMAGAGLNYTCPKLLFAA